MLQHSSNVLNISNRNCRGMFLINFYWHLRLMWDCSIDLKIPIAVVSYGYQITSTLAKLTALKRHFCDLSESVHSINNGQALKGLISEIRLFVIMSYFDSSNTWVLWWSDRGLMLYCRTWQVLGWILGVMYACKVPYCPSIDLIWNMEITQTQLYVYWLCCTAFTDFKYYM